MKIIKYLTIIFFYFLLNFFSLANSKEQNLLGSEDQNDSLLGGDSLTNGDDGSDFGEQPGFVGAGTRAIMGGSGGGDKKKKKKKKKKDDGIEFGQDE